MADNNKASVAGIAVGAAALIASAVALMKTQQVKASGIIDYTVALDEASQQLLLAIAQSMESEQGYSQQLVDIISNMSLATVPNTDSIIATRVQVPAVGRTQQLPDIKVPDDMILQIKSWPTNGGMVYVGNSPTTAANINQIWPLLPSEAIGYRVQNASAIYISGTVPGDFVAITVEQRGKS